MGRKHSIRVLQCLILAAVVVACVQVSRGAMVHVPASEDILVSHVSRQQSEHASQVLQAASSLLDESPAPAPTVASSSPDPLPDMRLEGTITSPGGSLAFVESDGNHLTLREGEKVGGFSVTHILDSSVELRKDSTVKTLTMADHAPLPPAPAGGGLLPPPPLPLPR